ncbi:MAG TPA: sugar nucleotide-binding protein [Trebonia sp.]|nr:sugar nucleotide-binding protein [Trebonia sp.]
MRQPGAALVQLSTDYVFDGAASAPYPEHATPAPHGAYGRTKLAGERAVLAGLPDGGHVVRTAWLYGAHGANFVRTMIRLARSGAVPAVVDDQRGQPTWSLDVARQVHALIVNGAPPGVYHATSSGAATWYGLARQVFALLGVSPGPTPQRARPAGVRRRGPPPACSATAPGRWPPSRRSATGRTGCTARSRRCCPRPRNSPWTTPGARVPAR